MSNPSKAKGSEIPQVILPYPPSSNRLWIRTRNGMTRSAEYKQWIEDCQILTIKHRHGKVDGPYALSIVAHRPDRRRRDIDNLIAPVCDGLMHSAITPDDSLCQWVYASWEDAKPEIPIVRVTLK